MQRRHFVFTAWAVVTVGATTVHAGDLFTDVTAASGIDAVHVPVVPIIFAGGSVADFNRDGFQDVFWAGGGSTPDRLYMNNGDGTFTDRAVEWGCALAHRSTGGAVGDYNNDGWPDLFVSSFGPAEANAPGNHCLYRNNGDGTFSNVAVAAGVNQTSTVTAEATAAAWGDYDLDGDLDLAVAGYGPPGGTGSQDGNRLFRNDGDGTFTDVTVEAGIFTPMIGRFAFGPRFVDMNGDRYPEIIWICDRLTSAYFVNNGDGTFTEATDASGTALGDTEMGFCVSDFDEDGLFDFYVTTIGNNRLYLNDGNHHFTEVGEALGVDETNIGWACTAVDFDHDTFNDIVVAAMSFTDNRQFAFRNTMNAPTDPLGFVEVAQNIGLDAEISGRGVSRFDFDNDGDGDIIFFPGDGPVRLFRNNAESLADANWTRIMLENGGASDIPPNGIGTEVRITTNGRTRVGRMDGGTNYLSQDEFSVHFGLGAATSIDLMEIRWTNGTSTFLFDVPANHTITVPPGGKPGDADLNGLVEFSDISALFAQWGACGGCHADFNDDGAIDFNDLLILLDHWD